MQAFFLNGALYFLGFFIAIVIEMEGCTDYGGQCRGFLVLRQKLGSRAYKAVFGTEFAFGATGYSCHFVAEVRISKAVFGGLDVFFMLFGVKAELTHEQVTGFFSPV